VVVGGPPHSGKSVLAYSLTRALRERSVPHYLLRAYPPDCEGDWFHEGDQRLVRHLRVKGACSEAWLPLLCRDVARRHLPLIVDMGGMPTLEQEAVLDDCTHAVLLTRGGEMRREWAARVARHGLVLLADLYSDLGGQNRLEREEPLLRGTLAGLARGSLASGPAFDALVTRLAELFSTTSQDLRRHHLESAPVELMVDIERLARRMGQDPNRWQPRNLPQVLDYLPTQEPLAFYGRGPNWLYAAAAAYVAPAPFFLFDVRLGWVEAPVIPRGEIVPGGPLTLQRLSLPDIRAVSHVVAIAEPQLLALGLPDAYLDITEVESLRLPPCPEGGAVLSGKLPLWLWAALVRVCESPWVAVVQPQVRGAVVVRSQGREPAVGTVLPVVTAAEGARR
jgi:CRISPR-associated protein Csx3